MKILKKEDLVSLARRGYIKNKINEGKLDNLQNPELTEYYQPLKKLETFNVDFIPYVYLFFNITNEKQFIRHIQLKWSNISDQLEDVNFSNTNDDTKVIDLCNFFINDTDEKTKNHRVYFFLEIIHQYFFPN
tara:strand:+ start:8403 stop:8798 length:396 start_codon:yes stop_codon:yes gene_type:complete